MSDSNRWIEDGIQDKKLASEAIHKADQEGKVPMLEVGKIHKDYYIILNNIANDLTKEVNAKMKKGYIPCGGLVSNATGDLYQAMVLKEMLK